MAWTPPTQAEVEGYFAQCNNWGRWGHDDQGGTLNLITPALAHPLAIFQRWDGISRLLFPRKSIMVSILHCTGGPPRHRGHPLNVCLSCQVNSVLAPQPVEM